MPTRGAPTSTARSGPERVADLLRVAILAAAIAAAAGGDCEATIKCALLLPPALLSRVVGAPLAFELAFVVVLAVEAIGSVLGVNASEAWNTTAHLVLPFLSGPLLYAGLLRLGLRMGAQAGAARSRIAAALATFAGVLALGALWELVEWAADSRLGTGFATSGEDTIGDLRHDAIAALGSGALVALSSMRARRPD